MNSQTRATSAVCRASFGSRQAQRGSYISKPRPRSRLLGQFDSFSLELWTEFSSLGHEHSLQAHYASFRCVRENRVEPGATQQLDRTASISPSHVFVMSALTLRTRRHPTEAVWKRNRNECEQVDFRRMR
jgi:hypothetical protein